jgi:hypothetical protein
MTKWSYQLAAPTTVVGDDVYEQNQQGTGDGWYRQARIASDGSVSILRETAQHQVTAMATDGSDWYWVESYGVSDPTEITIQPQRIVYTAPYTNSAATLDSTKKQLAVLTPGEAPFAAMAISGHYIVRTEPGRTELYRASDGHHTSIPDVGAGWCWEPLFASDSEFWCIERNGQNGANGVRVTKLTVAPW